MGIIETTKDMESDLTTNTVKGKIIYDDLLNWVVDYYSGTVTKCILWDFTEADLSKITTEEFQNLAEVVKRKSNIRERGKSALVFSKDLEFGLGRMFEAFSKMEDVKFEFMSFRNMAEARKWLGV